MARQLVVERLTPVRRSFDNRLGASLSTARSAVGTNLN